MNLLKRVFFFLRNLVVVPIAALMIVGAVVGVFNDQMYFWKYFPRDPIGVLFGISAVGRVGMDDIGRLRLCERLDKRLRRADDHAVASEHVRVFCEGKNNNTMVLEVEGGEVVLEGISFPEFLRRVKEVPYGEILFSSDSLVLTGDKGTGYSDRPVTVDEIALKLDELGAKSWGDFLAACGFHRFLIRNRKTNDVLMELKLTNEYSKNPVVIVAPFKPSVSSAAP